MALSSTSEVFDAAPFDGLASTYDEVFSESWVGKTQRELVWRTADRLFQPGQHILEINCGTGVDALHLARREVHVVACDIAPEMIAIARKQLAGAELNGRVEFRVLGTEKISDLAADGPFDGVLSDFAGLNCVADVSGVAGSLAALLRPGAKILLCVFGRFCVWEIGWYLARGNSRKAFRRLGGGPCIAHLPDGSAVEVQYPSVRSLRRSFAPYFRLKQLRGIGVAVPPTYLEGLAARHQSALRAAKNLDSWLSRIPVVRNFGDHILLTFERTVS